ncbi:hypothetical protein [Maribellus sediminis]|uniref:hypothetical protein n=1 Tax=Maribellus sediminis TaxID=2696285 RepID=UPI0014311600|nr:hypothetical protein [Maribellus sediminis]
MKKLLFISAFILIISGTTTAQSNWEAGVRFGNDFALDLTIPLSASPRLHGAVYFNNDVTVGAYFDWMFALSDGPSGLKFYPGVGPEFYFRNNFDVAVAGDFGVEYSFDFPLTIGLDWRPHFMVTNSMKFNSGNWGFIARFRFGEGVNFVRTN